MSQALEFLLMNFDRNHHKSTQKIRSELNDGTSLNEILHMLNFPSMICLQVYFAEKHGRLPETLIYAGSTGKRPKRQRKS